MANKNDPELTEAQLRSFLSAAGIRIQFAYDQVALEICEYDHPVMWLFITDIGPVYLGKRATQELFVKYKKSIACATEVTTLS